MAYTTPSNEQHLRQRSDELWSRLRTAWIQIPLREGVGNTSPSWQALSERFDRCFRRASFYVSRRVTDRESFENIVIAVLTENPDVFILQCSELEEMMRLKASADRFLGMGAATRPRVGIFQSACEHDAFAPQPDEHG